MAYAYVVEGSEDHIVAVESNKEDAFKIARTYVALSAAAAEAKNGQDLEKVRMYEDADGLWNANHKDVLVNVTAKVTRWDMSGKHEWVAKPPLEK